VSRNIGDFKYDPSICSFKHWLSQLVRWRIQDQYKKRPAVQRLAPEGVQELHELIAEEAGLTKRPDLEAIWDEEWKQFLIDTACARVKKQVSPKQFQIFYLHLLKSIPVPEVCQRLKVGRTQVYLAKLRVGRLFRQHVTALENTLV
jgi:DNA-directed RNA polymerase specialized sigma24 family protein